MTSLLFQRFQFNFQVETPLQLNFYSGSMLRGAFGHALRHLSCMTKMPSCKNCMLYRSCPYPLVFEHPPQASRFQDFNQIPNPYIIEPPPLGHKLYQAGELLSFNIVLMGSALSQLALIVYAWQRAFAFGLGKEKGTARLLTVTVETEQSWQVIFDAAVDDRLHEYKPLSLPVLAQTDTVSLNFITPLQLKKQGKILSDNMTARDVLLALVRRYYLLAEIYGQDYQAPDFAQLAEQAQNISAKVTFKTCNWQRYSHRQQQAMQFNGVLGKITLQGDLSVFLPLLQISQWLHLGNKTTFGMGQYCLQTGFV